MTRDAWLGYSSYCGQKSRCNNKNSPAYSGYGAKGVKVEYSPRDFISWWLEEMKYFNGKTPSVGRVDHSKNYSFENIEMVDRVENVKERNTRVGNPHPKKAIIMLSYPDMTELRRFESTIDVQKYTGVSRGSISRFCKGIRISTRAGYTFRYATD